MTPIRIIIIADDHKVALPGLAALLRGLPNVTIVASRCEGAEALNLIKVMEPDIVILDVSTPSLSGLDILASVTSAKLPTPVVLLSARFNDPTLRAAIAGGAHGILLNNAIPEDYVACITDVSNGLKWKSAELLDRIAASPEIRSINTNISASTFETLTVRERQVIDLVRLGVSNKIIAKNLNVSEGTVKIHLHNIYRKTGAANRTVLTAMVSSMISSMTRQEPRAPKPGLQ